MNFVANYCWIFFQDSDNWLHVKNNFFKKYILNLSATNRKKVFLPHGFCAQTDRLNDY